MNSRLGHLEAVKNGYDTAIFLNNQKKVSEGPGSCIFIIRDEKLITPPVTASILESITRQNIIDIAKSDLNIDVVERDIDRTELYICDEAFLCGTAMEITSVLTIDRYAVGNKSKGKLTEQLREFYFKMVRGKLKNYDQFLTPIY
jgi:branched-chain amino acid aminotransferase